MSTFYLDPELLNNCSINLEFKKELNVLFLAPHLSTGGMPEFLLQRIQALQQLNNVKITVVEVNNISSTYVVQKRKIQSLTNFYSLTNHQELIEIIKEIKPNLIHLEGPIEEFGLPINVMNFIYSIDRSWRVIETCHNVTFDPIAQKNYDPDGFAFCTPFHTVTFGKKTNIPNTVITTPIIKKLPIKKDITNAKKKLRFDSSVINVLNVGLWTPGKNQKEGLEIARKNPGMHFHFVGNLAENFIDYWKPLIDDVPKNVTIWGEQEDIETFMIASDVFMFNSIIECNPLVVREAISHGLPIYARNLLQYMNMFDGYFTPIWEFPKNINALTKKRLYIGPVNESEHDFAIQHLEFYKSILDNEPSNPTVRVIENFINGPHVELRGNSDHLFTVSFFDKDKLIHQHTMPINHWTSANVKYFIPWKIVVEEHLSDNEKVVIYESELNLKRKHVYIALESSALGDTIAWIPYIDQFQREHDCDVTVSTFINSLFKENYPNLTFVEPGTTVKNVYAVYRIGCYNDLTKEPARHNTVPLQQVAANILGLKYEEKKPNVVLPKRNKSRRYKYIVIASHSTAGCKEWSVKEWTTLVKHLRNLGYQVVDISGEGTLIPGAIPLKNISLDNTISTILNAKLFIGLSSGLSWLAWALGKKVVMIANFTHSYYEF